jgi:hypothetical protein
MRASPSASTEPSRTDRPASSHGTRRAGIPFRDPLLADVLEVVTAGGALLIEAGGLVDTAADEGATRLLLHLQLLQGLELRQQELNLVLVLVPFLSTYSLQSITV